MYTVLSNIEVDPLEWGSFHTQKSLFRGGILACGAINADMDDRVIRTHTFTIVIINLKSIQPPIKYVSFGVRTT